MGQTPWCGRNSISGAAGQSILSASTAHPQKRTAVNSALRSSSTNFLDLGQCFPTAGRDPTWAGVKTEFIGGHKVLEKAKEIFKLKVFCSVFSQLGGRGGGSGAAHKQMIQGGRLFQKSWLEELGIPHLREIKWFCGSCAGGILCLCSSFYFFFSFLFLTS